MAWSVLQSVSGSGVLQSTHLTPVSNLTSGSVLIAYPSMFASDGDHITAVSDGNGNNFTQIYQVNTAAHLNASVWALATPAGDAGTKPTFSVTCADGAFHGGAWLLQEVSGIQAVTDGTPAEIDGAPAGVAGSTGTPSYTTTASNEYLVSFLALTGFTPNWTATPSGYTLDANSRNADGQADIGVAYKNSTAGTESDGWSYDSGSQQFAVILVAFKLAGTSTPSGSVPALMAGRTEVISRATGRVIRR